MPDFSFAPKKLCLMGENLSMLARSCVSPRAVAASHLFEDKKAAALTEPRPSKKRRWGQKKKFLWGGLWAGLLWQCDIPMK